MIPELQKDIEIKYLFIKKFTYFNPEDNEIFKGHPTPGRVYKSVYNINSKHHRLLLPAGIAMGFNQLAGTSEGAEFELEEITINNILDFNIKEDDLDIFLQSNDDLFEPQMNLHQAMLTIDREESDFSGRASEVVLGLWALNPTKAEILIEIADLLTKSELKSHEEITGWMRFHPQKGLPLNIEKAIKALDRYWGDERKTSEDTKDLFEALEAICVELERRYDNE